MSRPKGFKHSEETRRKISEALLGDKHPGWKGGVSGLYTRIRRSAKYLDWRAKVLERDTFTCVWCGRKQGWNPETKTRVFVHADHIVPLCVLVDRHAIKSTVDAINTPELWETENGRCLCVECHKKTATYNVNLKYQTC